MTEESHTMAGSRENTLFGGVPGGSQGLLVRRPANPIPSAPLHPAVGTATVIYTDSNLSTTTSTPPSLHGPSATLSLSKIDELRDMKLYLEVSDVLYPVEYKKRHRKNNTVKCYVQSDKQRVYSFRGLGTLAIGESSSPSSARFSSMDSTMRLSRVSEGMNEDDGSTHRSLSNASFNDSTVSTNTSSSVLPTLFSRESATCTPFIWDCGEYFGDRTIQFALKHHDLLTKKELGRAVLSFRELLHKQQSAMTGLSTGNGGMSSSGLVELMVPFATSAKVEVSGSSRPSSFGSTSGLGSRSGSYSNLVSAASSGTNSPASLVGSSSSSVSHSFSYNSLPPQESSSLPTNSTTTNSATVIGIAGNSTVTEETSAPQRISASLPPLPPSTPISSKSTQYSSEISRPGSETYSVRGSDDGKESHVVQLALRFRLVMLNKCLRLSSKMIVLCRQEQYASEFHLLVATAPVTLIIDLLRTLAWRSALAHALHLKTSLGWTPFDVAVRAGRADVMQVLLQRAGRLCLVPIVDGMSGPMHSVVYGGDTMCAELLLRFLRKVGTNEEVRGEDAVALVLQCRDEKDLTPLALSCSLQNSSTLIIETLIRAGADANVICGPDRRTPLLYAAVHGNGSAVRMMLSLKKKFKMHSNVQFDISPQSDQSEIGIHPTVPEFPLSIYITNFKASQQPTIEGRTVPFSLTVADRRGRQPLHYAVENECIPAVDALLHCGATCTAVDEIGENPFHLAARTGNHLIIEYLLSAEKSRVTWYRKYIVPNIDKYRVPPEYPLLTLGTSRRLPVEVALQSGYISIAQRLLDVSEELYGAEVVKPYASRLLKLRSAMEPGKQGLTIALEIALAEMTTQQEYDDEADDAEYKLAL